MREKKKPKVQKKQPQPVKQVVQKAAPKQKKGIPQKQQKGKR